MKIAVYGDSHANGHINKDLNPELSWVEILSSKFDVKNFAVGGSGMFFSYSEFYDTHHRFDKIIFFATFYGRLYIKNPPNEPLHVPGINFLESREKLSHQDDYEKKTLEACREFYTYIYNPKEYEVYRNLMINDIVRERPDTQLFDVEEYYRHATFEYPEFQSHYEVFSQYQDLRQCHFVLERNIALFDMIKNNLRFGTTKIDYETLGKIKPSKKFEEYFISADSDVLKNSIVSV